MSDYKYKDAVALAYDANRKRLRNEGNILLHALLNEALNEMTTQFNDALLRGELLELAGTRDEMIGFLRIAAQRQLGVGS